MSTFLNRLTPETLAMIVTDLIDKRFLSRDEACAALEVCKSCAYYGDFEPRSLVVLPSDNSKPGWIVVEQKPEPHPSPDDGIREADSYIGSKQESQAPDSADRDDGGLL